MTIPSGHYQDPSIYMEKKEFFQIGCGGCAMHKPKPDRSEFHCIAECRLWPNGTNTTCNFFKKRKKERA